MSRLFVTNDASAATAELVVDDDGNWSGRCDANDWRSESGRWYELRDLVEEAGTHMDQAHR
ncbi:hypothetical protein [Micromonospora sp. NPDC050695]|uniref:hypothetical protein n=1 Tax=Micromonospora sp. NPDC050695 TaxID=3154938 RepID=UPI0033FB720D